MAAELALIAALDRRRAIGRGNALPWHLPDDLKRFKRLTLGHAVVMGRRTAQSIGRALPGRRNLVLTRSNRAPFPDQTSVRSLDEARALVGDGTLFVIGGGEVYALALPTADRLHLTWVDTAVADADAFFPEIDMSRWREVKTEMHQADERHAHAFRFADYLRCDS